MTDSDAKVANEGIAIVLAEHLEHCLQVLTDVDIIKAPVTEWLAEIETQLKNAALTLKEVVLAPDQQENQAQLHQDVVSALTLIANIRRRKTLFGPY